MKMTVAVCRAAGSMTSTFAIVLAIEKCKLPSEIDSMSVRLRYLFRVDGETLLSDRCRLPMMHLSGRLVDNQ